MFVQSETHSYQHYITATPMLLNKLDTVQQVQYSLDKNISQFTTKIFTIAANDIIASTVKEIGKQFRQAFMVEETKRDIYTKVFSCDLQYL